jgi:hypothetical protein
MGKTEMKIHLNGLKFTFRFTENHTCKHIPPAVKNDRCHQTTPVSSIAPAKVIKPVMKTISKTYRTKKTHT